MALFGKSRDINLFHTINSELLRDIIQTEVAYYKFVLEQTVSNVYGESMGKNYYEPMKIKHELKTLNLIPEIGDILLFRNNFFEIDSKNENQLILGRDPEYAMSTETSNHGDSFSIIVNAHLSRVEKLNLIPLREGKYPTITKVDGGIANQIP